VEVGVDLGQQHVLECARAAFGAAVFVAQASARLRQPDRRLIAWATLAQSIFGGWMHAPGSPSP
jgi:hypothetical protein